MGLKDNAQQWAIKEQIIEDLPTGLTLQFEVIQDDRDAPYRLRIFGNVEYGNREILFGPDGKRAGAGTALTGSSKPTWLTAVDE